MKKWQILTITVLAGLMAGGIALVRWLRPFDLATEEARARRAGLPLTAGEVGIPRPARGDDAYPLWTALRPALGHSTPREDALVETLDKNTGPNGRLNVAGLAAARELAAAEAGEDARIREAANLPAMYWPVTYSPTSLDVETAASLRAAAKQMSRKAQRLTAEGRYREAAQAAGTGLKIAKQAAAGPTLIHYLIAVAVDAIAVHALEDLLHQAGPNAEAASAVRSALMENPPGYDIVFAIRGEVVFHLNGQEQANTLGTPFMWSAGGPPGGVLGALAGVRPPSSLWHFLSINPSKAAYLHWMVPMVEAARKPHPYRVPAMERLNKQVAALSPWNPTYMPVRTSIDILPKVAQRGQQEDARRAVLLAAAEVMAYRAAHGVCPARLTGAAPKPPMECPTRCVASTPSRESQLARRSAVSSGEGRRSVAGEPPKPTRSGMSTR